MYVIVTVTCACSGCVAIVVDCILVQWRAAANQSSTKKKYMLSTCAMFKFLTLQQGVTKQLTSKMQNRSGLGMAHVNIADTELQLEHLSLATLVMVKFFWHVICKHSQR